MLLDSCQYVPHRPTDVQALGCDFLVASGAARRGGAGVEGRELRPLCPSFPLPAAQAAVACTPPIKHSLKPAAVSCGPVRIWFLLRLSLAGHKMLAPTASGFMWGRSARDESVARNQGARAPAAALSVGGELLCLPSALLLRMLCG